MAYSLEKDGDPIEVRYWEVLRDGFPNYEIFWSRFIVPLTGRAEGRGIGLRDGINPLLENVAMAHYTVLYHFGAAADLQLHLGQAFPEDILFHLSSATEMVERLIFGIGKMHGIELKALTEEVISAMTHEYLLVKEGAKESQYEKDFKRFLGRGQAVNVRLHQIDDLTECFMKNISVQAVRDFGKWKDIANQIRHYRNILAHNPRLGMLLKENESVFVPKESALSNYDLWSLVAGRSDNKDFILLADLLANFQNNLVEKTNNLWAYLIAFMEEFSKTDSYTRLQTGDGPTTLFIDDSQAPPPVSPMPSGTSSYDPTNRFFA